MSTAWVWVWVWDGSWKGFGGGLTAGGGVLHYIVGVPAASLPTTGTAGYDMMGYSASCAGGNCTNLTVNGSSLIVDFLAGSVDMNMNLTINGDNAGNYTFSSGGEGGSLSGASISGLSGTLSGPMSGWLNAKGFLSGLGGARAGLGWTGYVSGYNASTDLAGVTAYLKK